MKLYIIPLFCILSHYAFSQNVKKDSVGIMPGFVNPSLTAKLNKTVENDKSDLFEKFEVDYKENNSIYARVKPTEKLDISKSFQLFKNTYFQNKPDYNLTELKVQDDGLGETHYKYQQTYKGIPIEGNEIIFHGGNGLINSINGKFKDDLNINTTPAFDKARAIELAKAYFEDNTVFAWEDTAFIRTARQISENENVDLKPKIKTIVSFLKGQPVLCYIINISTSMPFDNYDIYIDAKSEKIISALSTILDVDAIGSAQTYYSGTQTITADNTGSAFRLLDNGRKIVTYDKKGGGWTNPTYDIYDADNNWGQVPYLEDLRINTGDDAWKNDFENLLTGPDVFFTIKNATNQVVYTSEVFNNSYPPYRIPLYFKVLLNDPPYTINFYDEDITSNTFLGGFALPGEAGNYTYNSIGPNGGTSGSYSIVFRKNPVLDIHWGMEKSYDFFKNKLNRLSFDGNGSLIENYTYIKGHFAPNDPSDYTNNAGAVPPSFFGRRIMIYGLGDGIKSKPVTKTEILGHEYTHHIVGEISNLIVNENYPETRAVNEAVADMLGIAIDRYSNPSTWNWKIGDSVTITSPFMRSLEDPGTILLPPNRRGASCYLDSIWRVDQGFSPAYKYATVLGHWFYLLCTGKSGTNTVGNAYSVSPINFDTACFIVYKTLDRLNTNASFLDFRTEANWFTAGYFGLNSNTQRQVYNAFYAVNLWNTPGSGAVTQCQSITDLTSPSGTFDDGSSTADYQNNLDCKWLIKPSGATTITLKFNYLNTESGKDTVIVYNGNTLTSPRIGVYSGTTFPDSIVVSGSQVLVRFKTDAANTAQGWSIKYTSNSSATSSCSGLQSLTSASGTITDGSGASNYVNNAECSWLIAPPGASNVTLNFTAFNTELNYDFVTVYNGNNTYAPVLGTFSGTSLPSALIANSGEMLVVFTSDGRTTAAGWSSNYTSSGSSYCSGTQTLTTATGTLSDGSGSVDYQNRLDCNWLIKPTGASSVTLTFDSLDVEDPPVGLPGTYYDYVNVYDGQNANATLLGTYAGSEVPAPITSSGNALFLVFHTDGRTTAKGWNAHYTSSTGQFCSGTTSLTAATGTFTDGSSASNYQSNSDCRWLIQPANATSIELTISPCDVEPGNDGILVYDGATVNSPLLGILTGNVISRTFTSTSGQMLVRFQSDGQNNYPGFSATYTANISPLGSNYSITGYEYWFDDNSNSRTFVSTPHVYAYNLNTGIPVNTLSTGVHTLNIRFIDNQDKWSSVLSSLFYKGLEDNNTINNITDYEYWFDNNFASKTTITVSAQKVLNLNTGLNTSGLTTGVHVLNIRFKDSGKQWSSVLSSLFYKGLMDNNAVNNITDYEYWFDDNYAGKVSTTVSPQKILNLNTGVSATSLQPGVHTINIRFKDSGTQWSSVLSQLFYKNGTTTAPVNNVSAYRYWYDRSTSNITTVILPSPVNPHELVSNIDVSSLATGAHTVHFQFKDLTDSWSGVTNDTFNVVAPVKAKFIANDTTLCYRGTVTFTNQSTAAVSYLWKFGDGDSSTTMNPSHTYNTPGFYTVTLIATNSQGVKDTLRKVNYISVTVPNVGVSPNVSICTGTSTQLVATGAVTYIWSPSTGLNNTTGSTVTATPGSNTTYRVIGTDQYGCLDTAFTTVTVSSVLQVGLSVTLTTICQGDTVTLTASGANSYTWYPTTGLNTSTGSIVKANPAITTTYNVIGTSTCGSDTESVTITVKPKPTTNAGRDTAICTGKSVLLTATGATTYAWSNGVNTAANTVTPISTSSYIVTGTTNGCSTKDTVLVSVNPLPIVNILDVNICPGGSYTFDAGNPGSSYLWQNSTTNRQLTASTAGLYWVQVTNTFGCVKRDSATVSLTPSLVINLRDTTVCQGQPVTLNAGNPGATYLWSNGAQTQSISVNQGGSYSVIVTGSGGCTGRDTAIVTMKPLPSTNAGRDTVICTGKSVSLTATGATTYAWSNGVNTAGNTVAPISTTSYIVTGTTNGCSTKDTVLVSVNPLPSINLPDVNICPGGSYTFDAGNIGSTYLWQNNATSQQLSANSAGLYWVQVTNTFGCIKRDSAVMTVSNNLNIGLRDTSICFGQSVTLNAGNIGASYSWSTGATTQTITVNQGNTYSVLVTASGGCSKRDTAVVIVLPLPTVTLSLIDTVSLNTAPFSLSGGLPIGGSYSGAGVTGGIFSPSAAGPGMHVITYTYTDVNGCSNLKKDSIFVQIVTGIKDNKNDINISIYPNPSNGIIKFTIGNVKEGNGDVEIINNLGQLLYSDKIRIFNLSEFTFDISNFASGIYYLKIMIEDKFKTYPIEVVK
ncbi:MAG: M4 family metallopeptidase [Sphingobacteriales bacterium]|nr:M4 family metallopeptidase [Sphingobacteriales bacterium]